MIQELYNSFGVQILSLIAMVLSLPFLNYAYYRKNMQPPFFEQLVAAVVTSIGVAGGAVIAHLNGLGAYINIAIYALMGVYFLALLATFGQLNPVLSPLIKKVISMLDKDGDGTIDALDPKDKDEK